MRAADPQAVRGAWLASTRVAATAFAASLLIWVGVVVAFELSGGPWDGWFYVFVALAVVGVPSALAAFLLGACFLLAARVDIVGTPSGAPARRRGEWMLLVLAAASGAPIAWAIWRFAI